MKEKGAISLRLVLFWAVMCMMTGCGKSELERKVDSLYDRMPQEERIAQLKSMYMDVLFDAQGKLDTAQCRKLIPYGVGHFSQFALQQPRDPNDLRDMVAQLQAWLMNNTPNGIPALFHEEVLSGINTLGATVYPQQIGQAVPKRLIQPHEVQQQMYP